MPYCLPVHYASRWPVTPFDAFAFAGDDEYQRPVYALARRLVESLPSDGVVLDYGCGTASKAREFLPRERLIGVDRFPIVQRLAAAHPDGLWLTEDDPKLDSLRPAVIVCADVIEHVQHPDQILRRLLAMQPTFVVLSTPARDLLGADRQAGPPANPHHVREWAQGEFLAFVSTVADVVESCLVDAQRATYCVICRPKRHG